MKNHVYMIITDFKLLRVSFCHLLGYDHSILPKFMNVWSGICNPEYAMSLFGETLYPSYTPAANSLYYSGQKMYLMRI